MKKLLVFAVALLVPLLLLRLRPDKETASDATPDVALVTEAPAAVSSSPPAPALQDSVVYLDVRTPEEYAAGHVKGTLFLPYDQIAARVAELESYRDRDIVVYCRTGRRSGIAIETLRGLGFTRLTNGGGLADVVRDRKVETETGAPAPGS